MTVRKSPLVSIGMAVRNCERTVAMAVRSILRQSYKEWELVVIDDGSTDGTLHVVLGFDDSRIRIIDSGAREGIAARLNQAIDLAHGEYFARMDGDDVSYPERLELQVSFLERHRAIDLLGGGILVFRGDGEPLGTRRIPETHNQICRRPWAGFHLQHPTWMGRLNWFRAHPYRQNAVRCEDQDLLLRTYSASQFANLPAILLGYQEHSLSLRKLLLTRYSFSKTAFHEYVLRGDYGTALGCVAGHCMKATVEAAAVLTRLDYKILRHRALPLDLEALQRWTEVWAHLQPHVDEATKDIEQRGLEPDTYCVEQHDPDMAKRA